MKRMLEALNKKFSDDPTIIAAFFYGGSGTQLEKSTSGVLRSLLYQVFTKNRALLEDFASTSEDGKFVKGRTLAWRVEELMDVFRILIKSKYWRPRIILLDALDESSRDEIRTLLFFFQQLFPDDTQKAAEKLRLCLSSRHYPNITLKDCPEIWAERHNQHDIGIFTHLKLSHMSETSENRHLVKSILSQADGFFLWVDLVTNAMLIADDDGETLSQKTTKLQNIPSKLGDLYTEIFNKLSDQERNNTFQIFKWVLHSSRKLSPQELCFALQFDSIGSITNLNSWKESEHFIDRGVQLSRFVRSRSCGLLEIRSVAKRSTTDSLPSSNIIQFIHQTVPEFLFTKGLQLLQPSIDVTYMAGACHHQIALTCITYLSLPQILSCASMTLLRYNDSFSTTSFPDWIKPTVAAKEATKACQELLDCYDSRTHRKYFLQDLKPECGSSRAAEIVSSDLPLLKYCISMLQSHLSFAEKAGICQASLVDLCLCYDTHWLRLWNGFQGVLRLPLGIVAIVDWADFLQGFIALELGSCVHEVCRRVSNGILQLPTACNLEESLHLAIALNLCRVAQDIITCGADPNLRLRSNLSPLDAASSYTDVRMVDMLIQCGAKVTDQNEFGYTPLHHAVTAGGTGIVQRLLEAGANMEACIRGGETPLLTAAKCDQLDVLKLLLAHGANGTAIDDYKRDSSKLAALHYSPKAYAFLNPQAPFLPLGYIKSPDPIPRAMTASPVPRMWRRNGTS